MSREVHFDGHWKGEVDYTCDCCHKYVSFDFESEEEEKDYAKQRRIVQKDLGWMMVKVGALWHDFCSQKCMDKYVGEHQ